MTVCWWLLSIIAVTWKKECSCEKCISDTGTASCGDIETNAHHLCRAHLLHKPVKHTRWITNQQQLLVLGNETKTVSLCNASY